MNILATVFLLLFTLVVVPAVSYFIGTPLGPVEIEVLTILAWVVGAVVAACFVAGELTRNVSQTDKLWSIMPVVYVWIVAACADYSPRLLLMAILVSIWGVRLTWNFSRHGGYQWKFWGGHEDYRWEVLRKRKEFSHPLVWSLFNLGFICGYQNVVILFFTLPTIVALQNSGVPLQWYDFLIAGMMLFFILYESIADNQQWNYQTEKYRRINAGEQLQGDYAKGFLDKGLWKYSRHPNYFAEQSIWVCFYLFSVSASGEWFNWSIAGCLLLIILFKSSSDFSEEISAGKYPEYADYQRSVPRFLPRPAGNS